MSAATISPKQRQRILHAHYLRQTGAGPKNIAVNLQVAPATIHEDLHLLEQHRHDIARQAANQLYKHSLADYPDDQLAALEPHRTRSNRIEQDRTGSNRIEQDRTGSNTIEQDRTQSITPNPPRPDRDHIPTPPEAIAAAKFLPYDHLFT